MSKVKNFPVLLTTEQLSFLRRAVIYALNSSKDDESFEKGISLFYSFEALLRQSDNDKSATGLDSGSTGAASRDVLSPLEKESTSRAGGYAPLNN